MEVHGSSWSRAWVDDARVRQKLVQRSEVGLSREWNERRDDGRGVSQCFLKAVADRGGCFMTLTWSELVKNVAHLLAQLVFLLSNVCGGHGYEAIVNK